MEGLVLAFGGRPVQVVDQLAAGQGAAGLPGQGLEQGQILPAEGADVAETVGHHEGPEHPGASSHGGDHGVGDSSVEQRLAQDFIVEGGGHEQDRLFVRGGSLQELGDGTGIIGRTGHELTFCAEDHPEGTATVGEHRQRRPLGPEQFPGLGQDGRSHVPCPLGLGDNSSEVVQATELLVLLPQRRIGPVGEEQHRRHHQHQPGDLAVGGQDSHRDEGQAGVGHRRNGPRGQRLPSRSTVQGTLVQ
jgi:hypothetical protein